MTRPRSKCRYCRRAFTPRHSVHRYCSATCQRRGDYLTRKAAGRCPHCDDPAFPGGFTCAYHRRMTQLRARAWSLRTSNPTESARARAQQVALRQRWVALRREGGDPFSRAVAVLT